MCQVFRSLPPNDDLFRRSLLRSLHLATTVPIVAEAEVDDWRAACMLVSGLWRELRENMPALADHGQKYLR